MDSSITTITGLITNNKLLDVKNLLEPYLDISDIWKLRLVSKKLYEAVGAYEITELSFLSYKYCDYKDNWFSTIRPINFRNHFNTSKVFILRNPKPNLLNLRCLRIKSSRILQINLSDLQCFNELRILEISAVHPKSDAILKLPLLESLSFDMILQGKTRQVLINTPNLSNLSFAHSGQSIPLSQLSIRHPLSIKYLKLPDFDEYALQFENLRCFELTNVDNLKELVFNHLESKFKYLKKLRINCASSRSLVAKSLLKLKRSKLEIVLEGVNLKEKDINDKYVDDKVEFQLANYKDLEDDLNYIKQVQLADMMPMIKNSPPKALFRKYNNIQRMKIASIKEENPENKLLRIIRYSTNLVHVHIENQNFDQRFYNDLPSVSSLAILKTESCPITDFRFAAKMTYLTFLITDLDCGFSDSFHLNHLEYLRETEFKIKGRRIKVFRQDEDGFHGYKEMGVPGTGYLIYKDLVQWFINIRRTS